MKNFIFEVINLLIFELKLKVILILKYKYEF